MVHSPRYRQVCPFVVSKLYSWSHKIREMGRSAAVRPCWSIPCQVPPTPRCVYGVARIYALPQVMISSTGVSRSLGINYPASWYAEDCERLDILQYLRPLNMFVLGSVRVLQRGGSIVWTIPQMDTETYEERHASDTRASSWYQQTGTHFDPFDAMTRRTYKQIECPKCQTKLYVREWLPISITVQLRGNRREAFVNDNNTGYTENFSAVCPRHRCRTKITKDSLAVAKFVRDLNQKPTKQDQDHYIAYAAFSFLKGRICTVF